MKNITKMIEMPINFFVSVSVTRYASLFHILGSG